MEVVVKKLNLGVANDSNSFDDVSSINAWFTQAELDNIKSHQEYLNNNPSAYSIIMSFSLELLASDGEESEFRAEGGELIIFETYMFTKCVHKHNHEMVIESVEITNEMLS